MNRSTKGVIAAAAGFAMALTSISVQPAAAAAGRQSPAARQVGPANEMTDISSAKRRHYRNGNRAAVGAFLGIAGTIAGIAAAEHYRRHYYDYDPYYAYPPYPYTNPYYAPRYYRYW
jgi:hypothetical protein